jgi:hypothetical protein
MSEVSAWLNAGPDVTVLEAVRRANSGGGRREGDWITIQAVKGARDHGLPTWAAEEPSMLWLRVQAGACVLRLLRVARHCAIPVQGAEEFG